MKLASVSFRGVLSLLTSCQTRCFKATVLYGDCPNFSVPCTIGVSVVLAFAVQHACISEQQCGVETDEVCHCVLRGVWAGSAGFEKTVCGFAYIVAM